MRGGGALAGEKGKGTEDLMDRGRQIGIQMPRHKTLSRQRSDEIDEERSARAILGGAFFERLAEGGGFGPST